MRQIVLLPQAVEDLDAIREPLYSEILNKIQTLQDYPHLGAAMEGPFKGYRNLLADPFRVIYRELSKERIVIAYLFHCKRRMR